MRKMSVAVLFGGRSAEHEVSLLSAWNIMAAISKKNYRVVPIAVKKDGSFIMFKHGKGIINPQSPSEVHIDKDGTPITFSFGQQCHIIALDHTHSKQRIDVIFPVLHGTFGEDGTMQGLFELSNVPFVGSGVLGSAIAMDKDVSKRLWREAGLPITDFLIIRADECKTISFRSLAKTFGLPFFVKPAASGSSVGVHKVSHKSEFADALHDAFSHSRKVLIEKMIVGKEIECSVLGNEHPMVSLPGIVIPQHDFYSYEAKYLDEHGAVFEIPAILPSRVIKHIQKTVLRAYQTLDLEGMARVDGFLTSKGTFILNEANTIPGFTKISMYPKLWGVSGVSAQQLAHQLIQLAISRHKRNLKRVYKRV